MAGLSELALRHRPIQACHLRNVGTSAIRGPAPSGFRYIRRQLLQAVGLFLRPAYGCEALIHTEGSRQRRQGQCTFHSSCLAFLSASGANVTFIGLGFCGLHES